MINSSVIITNDQIFTTSFLLCSSNFKDTFILSFSHNDAFDVLIPLA